MFIVLGVVGAGLSFILYIVGLRHTAPALASIVAMVEPVTASLFGVVVLDESLAALQVLGMGLILLTVTALGLQAENRTRYNDPARRTLAFPDSLYPTIPAGPCACSAPSTTSRSSVRTMSYRSASIPRHWG
nr:DMT family transporter [Stutzerimonas kunmingensis]